MGIKTEITHPKVVVKAKPFPKLMENAKNPGNIYLMSSEKEGVKVAEGVGSLSSVGEYSDNWRLDNLKDFEGTLTLSNN